MPEGWVDKYLGELIEIKHGFAFKGEFFCDEPIGDILLTPGNFAIGGGFKDDKFKYYQGPVSDEFVLHEGDLIVTMTDLSKETDTLGYPALVPKSRKGKKFLHNQRLGKVTCKNEAISYLRYLYYLMCSLEYRHEVVASATGTTVKHTSPERIKRFRFRLPPLKEQQGIACILGALDNKIELNRRMSQTLEAIAQTIFKSWFVDFDPVRAKADGKQLTGLKPETAALFPASLKDSELGEIPKGWRVGKLGEIIEIHDSVRIPLSSRERQKRQGSYRYYGAAGIVDYVDDFLFDGVYVLMGEDGSVVTASGTPVVQYVWGMFWVNNHAHVLKGAGGVTDEHLHLLLQQIYVAPFVTGAVQPKLSQTNMKAIPVVHGSPEVTRAFGRLIAPIYAKMRFLHDEMGVLAALRDSLLPKLISGELPVPDADRIAGRFS